MRAIPRTGVFVYSCTGRSFSCSDAGRTEDFHERDTSAAMSKMIRTIQVGNVSGLVRLQGSSEHIALEHS